MLCIRLSIFLFFIEFNLIFHPILLLTLLLEKILKAQKTAKDYIWISYRYYCVLKKRKMILINDSKINL